MNQTLPIPIHHGSTDPVATRRIVQTLVEAFRTDPVARWFFPDENRFTQNFSAFVRAFAGPALHGSTTHHLPDFKAVAAWFPPGTGSDEELVIELLQQTVPAGRLDEAFTVFEQMDSFHPGQPHWYLPLIGVHPSMQGRGHGSHLLRHALRHCDHDQTPAYLEASSPASVPLYQRHGFRLLGEIQAGSSPVLYPMQRDPQIDSIQQPRLYQNS